MIKALFVTNFCPHYRVKTFETLSKKLDVSFIFVSQGREYYWDPRHGIQRGAFAHEYLRGFSLTPKRRITPELIDRLLRARADVFFVTLAGRFALSATYCVARIRRKPVILWTGLWMHPKTFFHRLTFPFTRYLYTHSDAVVAYGSHVREYLVGLGVDPTRVFIAPHALDNDLYRRPVSAQELEGLRREHDLEGRRVVLHVGRLTPIKGLHHLVQAVAEMKDLECTLVLAGEGDLREALLAQAQEQGVDVRMVGYVPTGELFRYYALADVFVLPSVTTRNGKETWGLVVNEAMNQGVPVIASDAVGAAAGGLVRHGETGLIVREGDVQELSEALRRILTDSELHHRLGAAGRAEIAQWNNDRMTDAFVAAAEFALGAPRQTTISGDVRGREGGS